LFFHDARTAKESPWPLSAVQPWKWLYDYGVKPAWFLGAGGLVAAAAGCCWSKWRNYCAAGLFFVLLLALGPGLLVNAVCKPLWSRPRPGEITAFGGEHPFVPVLSVGEGPEKYSFPSGHAAMGFYLMAPAFVLSGLRPLWAAAFLGLGLFYGTLIGLARIVAGGHFASDVLWSAGIVYFTGLGLSALFGFHREEAGGE
jgi:lipid A 4'-phosphatase